MKITMISCLASLLLTMSGCAIRQNLASTPFNPINTLPTNDAQVDKDVSKGTKYCVPSAGGAFIENAPVFKATTLPSGAASAEGGGCVVRPIREVWAVLNNLEVMKFNEADRFDAVRTINPKADFTHLYSITYFKNTPIGPINFTIDWFHGVGRGTFEDPDQVNIEYQRTKGTSLVPIWQGGIGLIKISETVTSISVRNAFLTRALSVSANIAKSSDQLNEIIMKARGGAPDWNRLTEGVEATH